MKTASLCAPALLMYVIIPGAGLIISSVLFTWGKTIALVADSNIKTPFTEVLSAPIIVPTAVVSVMFGWLVNDEEILAWLPLLRSTQDASL